MANFFVSHSSQDHALAALIESWLTAAGHDVYVSSMPLATEPGDYWRDVVLSRLHAADSVICLVTEAHTQSAWCSAEVGIAVGHGMDIVPLLCELGVRHPILDNRQQIRMVPEPGEDAEQVRARARQILLDWADHQGLYGRRGWDDAAALSPYPGAQAFGPDRRAVFRGRHADIDAVAKRIIDGQARNRFAVHVVVGQSGCGKSSLVQAGVFPRFHQDQRWRVLRVTLDDDPEQALARCLILAGRKTGMPWGTTEVTRALEQPNDARRLVDELLQAPESGVGGSATPEHLLVIIEDLGQLATLAPARLARIADLLRGLSSAAPILTTMRWEAFEQLHDRPEAATLPLQLYPLRPPGRQAMRDVIEEPARAAGFRLDPYLAKTLVEDAGDGNALPLLQLMLAELAVGVVRGNTITTGRYDSMGGLSAIVTRQADAALTAAAAATGMPRDDIVQGLMQLVEADPGGGVVPQSQRLKSLSEPLWTALVEFETRRLITVDKGDDEFLIVRLTHPSLLTAWSPLADAIQADASGLRATRGVRRAAQEWHEAGRPRDRLWRGGQLALAREQTRASSAAGRRLDQLSRDFLRSSWSWDRLRYRGTVSVLIALTVVAAVTSAISLRQLDVADKLAHQAREEQRLAVSQRLVAEASAVRVNDPRLAVQLSLAAQAVQRDDGTRASLLRNALDSPVIATLVADSPILAAAYSPDGSQLATARYDGMLSLWSLDSSGVPRHETDVPGQPEDSLNALSFSPDGKFLATGDDVGNVIVWDVTGAKPVQYGAAISLGNAEVKITIHTVRFDPAGRVLAVGDDTGAVTLWDATTPGHPQLSKLAAADDTDLNALAYRPDGRVLATADGDGNVVLWDTTGPRLSMLGTPIEASIAPVYALAFSPDGRMLATGGEDNRVNLWNAADLAYPRIGKALTALNTPVWSVAFSPDGRTLGVGSDEGAVLLWNLTTPTHPQVSSQLVAHVNSVFAIGFSADGQTFVTASQDATAVVWDLRRLPYPHPAGPLPGHVHGVFGLAYSPDGKTLGTVGEDWTVQLWDTTTVPYTRLGPPLTDHQEAVYSIDFSPDGKTMATADDNGIVILWDMTVPARPKRKATLDRQTGAVYAVAFSPNGHTLALANANHTVMLIDITRPRYPKIEGNLIGHSDEVVSVAFSADGTKLATGSVDNKVSVWDLTLPSHAQIGQPIEVHTNTVWKVAFSPDSHTLATASVDRTVRLWDMTNPNHSQVGPTLTAHTGPVQTLEFSPDGQILATGGTDGQVLLWDLRESNYPALGPPLTPARTVVWSLAFSPDNRTLAVGGDGATALIDLGDLRDERDHVEDRSCEIAGRGLSEQQWTDYHTGLPYPQTC
ncbi:nSTAND1 domain-containing NTPase [Catellatospora tritici]|uniref:nSTAND1 domain-containing NTPase n=1 Tax=Catellatospora tritici TaxID=2851566 RepID=UPI001C2D8CDF|nr:TIR domain-containing protein [Catellatospora tritici]MBV1856339.1 TIR domain-containing protein [Catellatospora tritici]